MAISTCRNSLCFSNSSGCSGSVPLTRRSRLGSSSRLNQIIAIARTTTISSTAKVARCPIESISKPAQDRPAKTGDGCPERQPGKRRRPAIRIGAIADHLLNRQHRQHRASPDHGCGDKQRRYVSLGIGKERRQQHPAEYQQHTDHGRTSRSDRVEPATRTHTDQHGDQREQRHDHPDRERRRAVGQRIERCRHARRDERHVRQDGDGDDAGENHLKR